MKQIITSSNLIEAAPDLLAALKLSLEYWAHKQQRYRNRHPVWVINALQAIEKATGEKYNVWPNR